MDTSRRAPDAIAARLGPWDAASIIVGIIIGVGIFEIPKDIFQSAPGPWHAMGVWLLGGILAFVGALCFAELASTYPRSGGEYVYLTRACGPTTGFLFAWAQLAVIRPSSIGAMAYVFAKYACLLGDWNDFWIMPLAVLAVVTLTAINLLGVTLGSTTQNLLTVMKVLGLGGIVVVGLGWGRWDGVYETAPTVSSGWFHGAMIGVLWAYAGWHEAAYIAAEVKNGRRNIPLALLLGTFFVTVIYLLVNAAYLLGLGMRGAQVADAAAHVVALAWPQQGAQAMSVLIMVSALGAANGMIFTTARIYTEFGADHRLFQPLSHWSRRLGTPARALAVQGFLTLGLIVGMGWFGRGKEWLDTMIHMTAAVFWCFFLLTGVSLFVLRAKDPDVPRPFRVPWYPVLPLVFCGWCAYMVVGAVLYKPGLSLIGLIVLVAGLPLYLLPKKMRKAPEMELVGQEVTSASNHAV